MSIATSQFFIETSNRIKNVSMWHAFTHMFFGTMTYICKVAVIFALSLFVSSNYNIGKSNFGFYSKMYLQTRYIHNLADIFIVVIEFRSYGRTLFYFKEEIFIRIIFNPLLFC